MEDREILRESIEAIKEHAASQKDGIKMGLYMALEIIKGCVLDDDLILILLLIFLQYCYNPNMEFLAILYCSFYKR